MSLLFHRPSPAEPPLETVLDRYLVSGDERAMEEVVARTRPRLLGAARRIGRPQDAEDSVQTAYLSLVRRRGEPLEAPVMPWLLTAVVRIAYRRKAVDRRQLAIAEQLAVPAGPVTPIKEVATREEEDRVRFEVLRLPERYRDPVVLHYLQGLPVAETARLMDLPEATVRTRLHRARALLRWRLSPQTAHALFFLPWAAFDAGRTLWSALAGEAEGASAAGTGAALAAAAIPVLVLGILFGRATAGDPASGTAVASGKAEGLLASAEADRLRAAIAALDARASSFGAETARLREAAAARSADAPAALPASTPAAGGTAPPAGPRFPFPAYGKTLADADWDRLGACLRDIVPLIEELMKAKVDYGRDASADFLRDHADVIGRTQELNGPLATFALTISREGSVPGTCPNGRYTHPAVLANLIAATLRAADLPLDEEQAEALEAVSRRWAMTEDARVASIPADGWTLEMYIGEVELRMRYLDEALAILRDDQAAVLRLPESADRLGSVFSSTVPWAGRIEQLAFENWREAADWITRELGDELGIPADRRPRLRALVDGWVADMPASLRERPADPIERADNWQGSRILDSARAELVLLRIVAREFADIPGLESRARNMHVVSVLLPRNLP